MRRVEEGLGEPLEAAIRRWYLVEQRTIAEVAEIMTRTSGEKVNASTLAAWMVRMRLTRRELIGEAAARALAEVEAEPEEVA